MVQGFDGFQQEIFRRNYLDDLRRRLQARLARGTTLLLHDCGTTLHYSVRAPVIDISVITAQEKQRNLTDTIADLLETSMGKAEETQKRGLLWDRSDEAAIGEHLTRAIGQAIWGDPTAYTYRFVPEWHGYNASFLDEQWGGLPWSAWVPLTRNGVSKLPNHPGVYRLRMAGQRELFYLGYTVVRPLRLYLTGLWRAAFRHSARYGASLLWKYPAAPALWTWQSAEGSLFECSAAAKATEGEEDEPQRMAATAHALLWFYRREMHASPSANFGRFHPSYVAPVEGDSYQQGILLEEGAKNAASGQGAAPLLAIAANRVSDSWWMSLHWSGDTPLRSRHTRWLVQWEARYPPLPGVYAVLDTSWTLLKVEWTRDIYQAMQQETDESAWRNQQRYFRYTSFGREIPSFHLREVVSDLIGGYYNETHHTPALWFPSLRL